MSELEIVGLAGWLRDTSREPPSREETADEIEALYAEINRLRGQIEELKRSRVPAWVFGMEEMKPKEIEDAGQDPEPSAG